MSSFQRGVKCTVTNDGAVWMHLDVRIPPHVLNKSQVLIDAILYENDECIARNFTLAARSEWLQAWSLCCCSEEQRLSCADTKDLVNCLTVCSFSYVAIFTALDASPLTRITTVFTATRELQSTLLHNSISS
jgi:hypothetical protein